MRFLTRPVLLVFTLFFGIVPLAQGQGQYSMRSLLEKKVYYLDSNGKIGSSSFWALHLGKHSCVINKYFPGEGTVPVDAEINFSLLSSLYIEGQGYSERGKISADAVLAAGDGTTVTPLPMDSIDYIAQSGAVVKPVGREAQSLYLQIENQNLPVKYMMIRNYVLNKEYGELDHSGDTRITAFAFSKAAIERARNAGK